MEIYRGADSAEAVVVETVLRSEKKGMVYRDTLTTELSYDVERQLREVSLSDFRPDEYELTVRLRGRRYKKLDEKKTSFAVPWTQLARLRFDYESTVEQLRYIANPGEVDSLRDIEDLAERVRKLDEFWAGRDPEPSTVINEMRVEFYRRVEAANRLFTVMRLDGWRTDRGRVYIQFGEPDQIDDYPFVLDRRPYQEWHYYRSGRYRKFVFVDANDDGDYRLQYPYDGLYQRPDF